jgi:DNA-binding MarR family transcriptional regulator
LAMITQDNEKAPERLARLADEISRMRQARNEELPGELLGEPAWDILLAVYKAGVLACRQTELYQCLTIPRSATDRWIAALQTRGLLARSRSGGSDDHVFLTVEGKLRLERALDAMWHAARD